LQTLRALLALAVGLAGLAGEARGQEGLVGTIDLMKSDGVAAVKGEWRYHEVTTGTGPNKNEIEPKAHGTFDDSKWEVLKPETLGQARGPGGYSWCWYRIRITVPEKVNGKDAAGTSVWFRTTVDDYGEVWVNGKCDLSFGRSGRGAVSGFNTRNRVLLTKSAKPGTAIQVAVLGINGPLGRPPGNKIFLRSPTDLQFFAADAPGGGADVPKVAPGPQGTPFATLNLMKADDVKQLRGEWRYHDVAVHTWFRTTVDDYGEVWVNGNCDLSFGSSGRGAISGFNAPNQVLLTKSAKPGEEIQIAVLGINGPFGVPPGNNIFLRSPTDLRFYKR
jgi:hypothetical protein